MIKRVFIQGEEVRFSAEGRQQFKFYPKYLAARMWVSGRSRISPHCIRVRMDNCKEKRNFNRAFLEPVAEPKLPKPKAPLADSRSVIQSIKVIRMPAGADIIVVETNLPSPVLAMDEANMSMSFKAARDTGEAYVKQHFPDVKVEVADMRRPKGEV